MLHELRVAAQAAEAAAAADEEAVAAADAEADLSSDGEPVSDGYPASASSSQAGCGFGHLGYLDSPADGEIEDERDNHDDAGYGCGHGYGWNSRWWVMGANHCDHSYGDVGGRPTYYTTAQAPEWDDRPRGDDFANSPCPLYWDLARLDGMYR